MKNVFLLSVLILFSFWSYGSHIRGGQLTARCIDDLATSGYEYEVELVLLVATTVDFSGGLQVDVKSGATLSSMMVSFVQSEPIVHNGFFARLVTLRGDVTLNRNQEYIIAYSSCCRPPGLWNLNGNSAMYGFSYWTYINTNTSSCNSTPEFVSPPISNWPSGRAWMMPVVAFDVDGDSLEYHYGLAYQENASSVYYLDPIVWDSTFAPGSVSLEGRFTYNTSNLGPEVNVHMVKSYTQGLMTSMVFRDMELALIYPPISLIKVVPPLPINRPYHSWKVTKPDTLTIGASAADTIHVEMHVPRMVNKSNLWYGTVFNASRDSVQVNFTYHPRINDVGFEFPIVFRFTSNAISWDEVVYANAVSDVGLVDKSIPEVFIYPNPSHGYFEVESSAAITSLELISSSGKSIFIDQDSYRGKRYQVNSGVYFLCINFEGGSRRVEPVIVN